MKLKGKVAIVTGAKSGMGFATARRFVAEGAKVVVADVADATKEASEISGGGRDALFVQVDVSKEAQVKVMVEKTVSTYGRLDVLVNNAGIDLAKKITDTTEAEWDHLMGVNLKGVFLCSKAAIPAITQSGGGAIVNVASELGTVGAAELAAYCASKGAVIQLTKAMAIDHAGDNIRVNCVCPGPIMTQLMHDRLQGMRDPDAHKRSVEVRTLLGRLGRAEEIANVIAFLASDESSYMTGSILLADGGWTAR